MLFSSRHLAKIIIPLMLEQTLAITTGMADSIMVASAGEAAVSGVSLVDTVNLLMIYLFTALAGGGAVVISQFIGRNDLENAKSSAKQLIWIVLSISSALMIIALILRAPLLRWIFGSIDQLVMENANVYFLFTAMSFPFFALYNSCAAIFRSMGNSKISLNISIVMNAINVLGNALLIFVFHMGAAGAAIATLVARIIGAALMLVFVHNKKNIVYVEKLIHYKPNFLLIKKICSIGIPNGFENSMFQFGKVMTQSLISTFGTAQIAANAVGNAISPIQYIPGNAIGLTMITIIGQCVGAREKEQAKKYALKLLTIAYLSIITISVFMCIFAKPLISFYNLSYESSELTYKLIIYHSLAVSLIWPTAFTLPNSFRAANDVKFTMILSITSMWIFRVGLSYVFGLYMNMGVMGVWYAMTCDWLFRAIIFGTRYIKGTWLKRV